MALLRCNTCSYLREVENEHIGKTVKCPACEQPLTIYDTVFFVKKTIEKYGMLLKKYRELEQTLNPDLEKNESKTSISRNEKIDLHNTDAMSNSLQYKPIVNWFERKNIGVEVKSEALDTHGFYDEVAIELGDNLDIFGDILEKIRKTQRNNYNSVAISLSDHSQNQIKSITGFCKHLYEYSFVSKYFYNKNEKRIHLTLQTVPEIVRFFNGEWLEWYVYMTLLKHLFQSGGLFSCLRSFNIQFVNEDKYEVDIFFLINSSIPVFIECKSGEFRSFIEKYSKMRRRLDIDKKNFLILVLGLSDEQTFGLTNMYEITFVNEKNLIKHVAELIAAEKK